MESSSPKKISIFNSTSSPFASPVQPVIDQVRESVDNLVTSLDESTAATETALQIIAQQKKSPMKSCRGKKASISPVKSVTGGGSCLRTEEGYLTRLKTFTLDKWFGKPLCLSPPFLAQFGWECFEEDVVKCVTCSALFAVRLPWRCDDNYVDEVKKSCLKMKESHYKMCAWPSSPSLPSHVAPFDENFLSEDIKKKLIEQFHARMTSLRDLKSSLPFISKEILGELELTREGIVKVCKHLQSLFVGSAAVHDDISEEMTISAFVLAMCGWCNSSTEFINLLTCEETNKNIGLWGFISIDEENNNHKRQVSPSKGKEPSPKRRKTRSQDVSEESTLEHFHPLHNNYRWSSWTIVLHSDASSCFFLDPLNHAVQTDKKPGWQVVKNLLLKLSSNPDHSTNIPSAANGDSLKTPTKLQQAVEILDAWSPPTHKVAVSNGGGNNEII